MGFLTSFRLKKFKKTDSPDDVREITHLDNALDSNDEITSQIQIQNQEPKRNKGSLETTSELTANKDFEVINQNVLESVKPIVALLQAHSKKNFFDSSSATTTNEPVSWNVSSNLDPSFSKEYIPSKITVSGKELLFETEHENLLIPLVEEKDNIFGCNIVRHYPNDDESEDSATDSLHFQNSTIVVHCSNPEYLDILHKSCLLSIFEYMSIFKSLTGTLLSSVGTQLPDINVILNSNFSYRDWCEIYLENEGWVKVWCHIDSTNKNFKNNNKTKDSKANFAIKFYNDNKSLSSKNLICSISNISFVKDIFFYKDCQITNVNDLTNLTPMVLIESINMIRLLGDISFHSAASNETVTPPQNRIMSSSSRLSFFNKDKDKQDMDTNNNSDLDSDSNLFTEPPPEFASPTNRAHKRISSFTSTKTNLSTSSLATNSSSKDTKKLPPVKYTNPNGLIIRPTPHNGISHIETMLRFIVPMMDVAGLYGRPAQFRVQKNDPCSLMFGLPSLPTVDYFAKQEMDSLIETQFTEDESLIKNTTFLAMHHYTHVLKNLMDETPDREQTLNFTKLHHLPFN
ncbi:hypothetical protein TBLA_0H02500 [Henningerozyma blattae CBS 6284]|uniref:Skg3/CAF120-like PH-like domain-containing protein n=1 Tax=Henningerozyma blattae (strain ATCC 34711 / CBS 6284 / DSM 70876 / NBRC 10599 / NRRL Y-10934 / UCD 77-7) TaxID=1071380 RepID=I2H832_HENB6|nr:hypothetical protein TBLA_0H02500 [Tetrapisispora blattae CBS 6284]CCH62534.1 hypothetical protein TBLA_0H02500 [Tetrapisispora blattae CBS 6284]